MHRIFTARPTAPTVNASCQMSSRTLASPMVCGTSCGRIVDDAHQHSHVMTHLLPPPTSSDAAEHNEHKSVAQVHVVECQVQAVEGAHDSMQLHVPHLHLPQLHVQHPELKHVLSHLDGADEQQLYHTTLLPLRQEATHAHVHAHEQRVQEVQGMSTTHTSLESMPTTDTSTQGRAGSECLANVLAPVAAATAAETAVRQVALMSPPRHALSVSANASALSVQPRPDAHLAKHATPQLQAPPPQTPQLEQQHGAATKVIQHGAAAIEINNLISISHKLLASEPLSSLARSDKTVEGGGGGREGEEEGEEKGDDALSHSDTHTRTHRSSWHQHKVLNYFL